ncbi:hypothetical protein AVEN_270583-1 [Araneus ventricosus]|uniref:Uncharacterized protein n=1 Tax=Araneus ventricosus TaxID=182803 RepID=A0A4Y2B5Q8_ARAVE|nr:hypothetical protein AVEN_270583-1 [Araneus ventricosus]
MKSSLSLQKFQEEDTLSCTINCQQRKELIFSRKIHPGALNRLSPACVEIGGLRRDRAHRVKRYVGGVAGKLEDTAYFLGCCLRQLTVQNYTDCPKIALLLLQN